MPGTVAVCAGVMGLAVVVVLVVPSFGLNSANLGHRIVTATSVYDRTADKLSTVTNDALEPSALLSVIASVLRAFE